MHLEIFKISLEKIQPKQLQGEINNKLPCLLFYYNKNNQFKAKAIPYGSPNGTSLFTKGFFNEPSPHYVTMLKTDFWRNYGKYMQGLSFEMYGFFEKLEANEHRLKNINFAEYSEYKRKHLNNNKLWYRKTYLYKQLYKLVS